MIHQGVFDIHTNGRGTYELTAKLATHIGHSGLRMGICHLFLEHTSASLILCENADPDVHRDLEHFLTRLCPDGDRLFHHSSEGDDDMPAHVRSILTHSDLTIPVANGRLALGGWQGIYLYEHRLRPHMRSLRITLMGE